ncbi:MAG TPA: hypothetical protein VHJ54_03025 [Solirubrobacterales bacterium]|nr:hypothetical protein [Solirubrobacterales bacterium]
MSVAAAAILSARADWSDTKRMAVLFMIGSACFAIASLPAASDLSDEAVGITYFVGSIFFTSGGFEQLRTAHGKGLELWAAIIQFVGTLWFNIDTFDAMSDRLSSAGAHAQNLLVWTPDAAGSICFLVSSVLAGIAARAEGRAARHIAWLNLAGSIAFGASAIAAYVVPNTGDLLDASLATSGTLIGAICFLWGAALLWRSADSPPESVVPA